MKQIIIIDGREFLNQFPELRKVSERDLDAARKSLVNHLTSCADEKGAELVVVFDGDGRVTEEPVNKQGIKILFSEFSENTGQLIRRLIKENERQTDLLVVSSDNEIARCADLCGVQWMSPRKFVSELLDKSFIHAEKKYDHPMSQAELEEWMQLFGVEEKER